MALPSIHLETKVTHHLGEKLTVGGLLQTIRVPRRLYYRLVHCGDVTHQRHGVSRQAVRHPLISFCTARKTRYAQYQ